MLQYRSAAADDLHDIGHLFAAAFGDSVRHVGAGDGAAQALSDVFGLAMAAEPGCLLVAEDDGQIVGYMLASRDLRRLRRTAFWQRKWLRVLWRLVTGRYGVGWRELRTVVRDKGAFARGARRCGGDQARLLSLAVRPDRQGRGIGRGLIAAGLEYLRAKGARTVRLEVRPDNAPARHLYEAFGFHECGEYSDSQGQSVMMLKEGWEEGNAR